MYKLYEYLIIFVLAIVLTAPFYTQAQHPEFISVREEIKSKFESRRLRIAQELANSQTNEWAGTYWAQLGSIDGALFYWSPISGFAVRSGNDFHRGVERVNYGSTNFSRGLLNLSPQYLEKDKHNYNISTTFVPIKWGQQHWLIRRDKLIQFIYAVNSGDEINNFFIKEEDLKKTNDGSPDVPQEYRKYLNRKPIKAKAIKVKSNNDDYLDYIFTLNVGKTEGVIEEMKFYLTNVKDIVATIEITEVTEHRSTARVTSIGSSGNYNKKILPSIGWIFSSKIPPLF